MMEDPDAVLSLEYSMIPLEDNTIQYVLVPRQGSFAKGQAVWEYERVGSFGDHDQ